MGRLNLAAQRVQQHTTQLIKTGSLRAPPPWYKAVSQTPPGETLVRPLLQRTQPPSKKPKRNFARKASRVFKPVNLKYEEDALRWEYFNDHPWELARPRVVLENDGRDTNKWDWSHSLAPPRPGDKEWDNLVEQGIESVWEAKQRTQAGRPLNGEAVVQRQKWLLNNTDTSPAAAYDTARKELYRARHAQEIERRVAREEALATGAYFGMSPLDVGNKLEDEQVENWKAWAEKEVIALKQLQGGGFGGQRGSEEGEGEDGMDSTEDGLGDYAGQELQEVSESVPASKRGQTARGGAGIRI
ncbi:hypothetical protein K431DRAFT_315090 [Polychaeton citri CBS 116435]|uniref:Small ribosomal subunit protein mS23 n=1 Tax=Polychaeton citri CBS 116435 TaxID=1314669 RepID=A0A9P4UJP5_9PEZI|nr:hypothetical protein K431DRAFT_315090 [Polychaeton citri CBS 116435]